MAWSGLAVQMLVSAYLWLLGDWSATGSSWTTEQWLTYEGVPDRDAAFVQAIQDVSAAGGIVLLLLCLLAMLAVRYAFEGISAVGRWPVVGLAALSVTLYLLALIFTGSYWALVPVLWIATSGGLLLTPRASAWYKAKAESRPARS